MDAELKFGLNPDKMRYYWELIAKQDSINERDVTIILDRYGWLGIDEIGEKCNKIIAFIS